MVSEFEVINRELSRGEKLLWSGQPKQGLVFRPIDALLIPFFLFWTSGPVAIVFSVDLTQQENIPSLFLVVPFAFVLIGSYMLFGRFIVDAMRRKNTFYGLTDKRAIIASKSKVKSVPITATTELEVKRQRKGFGTIQVGGSPGLGWSSFVSSFDLLGGPPNGNCFERISGAEEVYRMAKELRGF